MLKGFNLVFTKGALWRTMLFKTILEFFIFVSSDTLRESEYISFQSNWTSGNWSWNLACVQTSPLPQKKSGDDFFSEGGGTSVHRLLKPLLSRWRSLFRHFECIVKRFWRDRRQIDISVINFKVDLVFRFRRSVMSALFNTFSPFNRYRVHKTH